MARRRAEDLTADYAAAGFGNRLGVGARPVLLVVDIVRAYLEPESPLYAGVESEVAAAARLVEAARESGVPAIFTNVRYTPGGADGGLFYRKVRALAVLEAGSPLGDFPDHPAPHKGEIVVTKQYASAFFGTSLASTLTAMGADSCFICGLTTSGCVRASALDALQHGFVPLVVPEACGDRDTRVHEANIFDLGQKYADILPLEEALAAIARCGAARPA